MTSLARAIDYTLLKPDATTNGIKRFCQRARKYNVYGVCVSPVWVKDCERYLKGADIKVGTVIGFPLGSQATQIKSAEAKQAIKDGAQEIDMVINIGYIKSGWYNKALRELKEIVRLAHRYGVIVKVIIETAYLSRAEIVKSAGLVIKSGADFVKTSTGFALTGALIEDIKLLKKTAGNRVGIKAAGGIRTKQQALAMLKAGADRLGISAIEGVIV